MSRVADSLIDLIGKNDTISYSVEFDNDLSKLWHYYRRNIGKYINEGDKSYV